MKFRHLPLALMFALGFHYSSKSVDASDGLLCLARTKGKVVQWDREWQMDSSDHDVKYLIEDVKEKSLKPGSPHQFALQLLAQGPAKKPKRVANIVKDVAADMFCLRVIEDRDKSLRMPADFVETRPSVGKQIEAIYPVGDLKLEELSFRRWNGVNWVPGNPNPDEPLYTCYTAVGPIACTKEDSERNKTGGVAVKAPTRLLVPGQFLRHLGVGWVRAEPIGDFAASEIARCSLLGKQYFCLSEEKQKYGLDLVQLEQDVTAHEQLHPPRDPAPPVKAKTRK